MLNLNKFSLHLQVCLLRIRWMILWPALLRLWGSTVLRDLFRGKPFLTWNSYKNDGRVMAPWRGLVNWVGGVSI